jgi:hypothetical protein
MNRKDATQNSRKAAFAAPGMPSKQTGTIRLLSLAPCTIGRCGALVKTVLARGCPSEEGGFMEGGYADWMGQAIILRVVAGNLRVPLRGRLVSETDEVIRLRIAESWDVDIFKSMVLAVEHDNPVYVVN